MSPRLTRYAAPVALAAGAGWLTFIGVSSAQAPADQLNPGFCRHHQVECAQILRPNDPKATVEVHGNTIVVKDGFDAPVGAQKSR